MFLTPSVLNPFLCLPATPQKFYNPLPLYSLTAVSAFSTQEMWTVLTFDCVTAFCCKHVTLLPLLALLTCLGAEKHGIAYHN